MTTLPASTAKDHEQVVDRPGVNNVTEQSLLLSFCLENDLPFLPTSGEWSTKALAKFLKMEDETLKGWIKDYQIPHRGTSRTTFVDVVEMRNRLPENFMFDGCRDT